MDLVISHLITIGAANRVRWASGRASMHDECFVKLCEDSSERRATTDARKRNGTGFAPERYSMEPFDHTHPACAGSTGRALVVLGQVHF